MAISENFFEGLEEELISDSMEIKNHACRIDGAISAVRMRILNSGIGDFQEAIIVGLNTTLERNDTLQREFGEKPQTDIIETHILCALGLADKDIHLCERVLEQAQKTIIRIWKFHDEYLK